LYSKPWRLDYIPQLRKGDPAHVQGFILYKLWMMRCFARGGSHHRHVDLERDLYTNYGREFQSNIIDQARELHRNRLVTIFRSEGREAISATFPTEAVLQAALPIINAYLETIGQAPLEPDIREILTDAKSHSTAPLSAEELRRYATMHRRARRR